MKAPIWNKLKSKESNPLKKLSHWTYYEKKLISLLYWVVIFTFCFATKSWSQIIFHLDSVSPDLVQINIMSKKIQEWRTELAGKLNLTNRKLDIFQIKNEYFAIPDGMGTVLKFNSSSWVRIDKVKHHGYNYLSKKFTYKGHLHSFGGYGFWRTNALITSYDTSNGEWEVIPAENEQSCSSIYSFIMNDALYVLSPTCTDDSQKIPSINDQVISYNFNTHRWNKLGSHDIKMTHHIALETDHYFYIHNHPRILIDKQSLQYKSKSVSYLEPFNVSSDSSLFIIWKDSILFRSTGEKDLLLDLNHEYDNLGNEENLIKSGHRMSTYLLALFCVIVILSFILIRSRNKIQINDDPLILELIKLGGHTINQDRLDEILKINEIKSADTRKVKRSKLINQINRDYQKLKGKDLINRVKNDEDMRFFKYSISK